MPCTTLALDFDTRETRPGDLRQIAEVVARARHTDPESVPALGESSGVLTGETIGVCPICGSPLVVVAYRWQGQPVTVGECDASVGENPQCGYRGVVD